MKGHGMFQDRDVMGKLGLHRKMGEYFPQQSDTTTDLADNSEIRDAGDVADGTAQRMEGAPVRQGVHDDQTDTDGRAIDANKPKAQMREAGTRQNEKKTKTFINKRGKTKTLVTTPSEKGSTKVLESQPSKIEQRHVEPLNFAIAAISGGKPGTQYVGTGQVDQKYKWVTDRKPGTVEFTGKRGNTKSAEAGTWKAKHLKKKFSRGQGRVVSTNKSVVDGDHLNKSYTTKKGTLNIKIG